LSDPLGLTAQPHDTIPNNKHTVSTLSTLISDYDVAKIIMGLPKNLHGNDSPKSLEVKEFCKKISKEISIPIIFWDERHSTKAAIRQLHETGVPAKKQRGILDSRAAAYILHGYLDSL